MTLGDWITVSLTAALVIITGIYAALTYGMMREMRRSREQSLLPNVTVNLRVKTPGFGVIAIQNVGSGPALDVDLTLLLKPVDPAERQQEELHFRTNVLSPGEQRMFYPPLWAPGVAMDMDRFAKAIASVQVTGTVRDALGHQHTVDREIEDLASAWEVMEASREGYIRDPVEEALREFTPQAIEELAKIRRTLQSSRGLQRADLMGRGFKFKLQERWHQLRRSR